MKNKSILHIQAYAVIVETNIIFINKPLYKALTYFSQKNKDIWIERHIIKAHGQHVIDFFHYFTQINNENDVNDN